ncbi:MAG: helix-turn-helix transcriptional regulator, partial [Clostridia bacterium]|nr:helix-turn-helix transcriptional regulator [Clostridia bacterium]
KIQQTYISAMLTELINENKSDSYAVEIASEAILLRFLVELNRLTISSESAEKKEEGSSSIIPDVLEYINNHYCEKLTLNSIADEFFVSKYYLSHAFNNAVGTSVHRYIVLKRLIHAKQMLLSGIKSTTAAENCGFNDYAGFYRAFTAEYGVTPTEFVKMNK